MNPQYAQWEEAQKDFRRARSVWERALDINYRHIPFWLKVLTPHPTGPLPGLCPLSTPCFADPAPSPCFHPFLVGLLPPLP